MALQLIGEENDVVSWTEASGSLLLGIQGKKNVKKKKINKNKQTNEYIYVMPKSRGIDFLNEYIVFKTLPYPYLHVGKEEERRDEEMGWGPEQGVISHLGALIEV